jgi:hypothetical protein
LGKTPRKGDTWRVNVLANPAISANQANIWSHEYDPGSPFVERFGILEFE